MIIILLFICIFSLCCSTEPPVYPFADYEIPEDVDPNVVAFVRLKLEGDTMPGAPKVVPAIDTSSAMFIRMGNSEDLRQTGKDTWISILKPGESYVVGWLTENNEMFGYCSEPFVAENELEFTFSPGMPLTLEYDLTNPQEDTIIFPVGISISRKTDKNGKVALLGGS